MALTSIEIFIAIFLGIITFLGIKVGLFISSKIKPKTQKNKQQLDNYKRNLNLFANICLILVPIIFLILFYFV
jgi:NAD/NADP transhydrogenase beta subunit